MDRYVTPLRFERFWIIVGSGFVLLVIYLSLSPDPPDLGMPKGLKIGHVLAYGWLMIWFAQIYRATSRRLLLAAAFCALGIALEYVQKMTDYRGFEYSDMLINATGVVLGLALAYTRLQNGLRTLEAVLRSAELGFATDMRMSGLWTKTLARALTALTASRRSIAIPSLLMVLLSISSEIPGRINPDDPLVYRLFLWVPPEVQNLLHLPAYGLLAASVVIGLCPWRVSAPWRFVGAVLLAGVFGLVDEWHQSFVPGRYASATDVSLNIIGALIGAFLAQRWIEKRPQVAV